MIYSQESIIMHRTGWFGRQSIYKHRFLEIAKIGNVAQYCKVANEYLSIYGLAQCETAAFASQIIV